MCTEKLLTHLTDKLGSRQRLLVAFSGGIDSTALLHLLVNMRELSHSSRQLRAVHIHHGLSRFSDDWMYHCQRCCKQWQVPLEVIHVNLDTRQRGGIEAVARKARYQALGDIMSDGEVLLTAQHQNDQCETLLLALKRGSGPAGLSSMAECRAFFNGEHLRPLLEISRYELERYASRHHLPWVEDNSNQDERFDRNFLRHSVLPPLLKRWPHFADTTARSASLCAEQEQLLDELLHESLKTVTSNDNSICITGLLAMSSVKRFALLRRWIACCGALMPGRDQLQLLWHEVALCRRKDAQPRMQLGRWQVRRYRQRLYVLPVLKSLRGCVLPWDTNNPLLLPDGLGKLCFTDLCFTGSGTRIRAPVTDEQISVRFSTEGNVNIVGRHHARQIKKLWQELAVPPWQRGRIPLLFYDNQLITAPGLFVTWQGQAEAGKPECQLYWEKCC